MPWQECSKMDERLRFVARLLDGEKMAVVCREFDISRKTGYKILERYKDCGLDGLTDRSRRPYRHANRLPFQIEKLIVSSSGSGRVGALPRSGRSSGAFIATFSSRRSAPCTPCFIATDWSTTVASDATKRRAPRYRGL